MTKKLITKTLYSISYELDGLTIDKAVEYLQSFKTQYPQFEELKLSWDYDNDTWNSSNDHKLFLVGIVEETDKEYAARLKKQTHDEDLIKQ